MTNNDQNYTRLIQIKFDNYSDNIKISINNKIVNDDVQITNHF